jgi:cytochrome b
VIPVWSWVVRLSHWGVAAAVLFNLFNETGPVHRWTGYLAAGLVVLRLLWGWTRPVGDVAHVGWPGLAAVRHHVQALRQRQVERSIGHNPLGLCMALLLWTLILLLGITGWMTQLDAFWGDDRLIACHELLADILLGCVLVHWAGVLLMSRLQRENLLIGMVTGRKRP